MSDTSEALLRRPRCLLALTPREDVPHAEWTDTIKAAVAAIASLDLGADIMGSIIDRDAELDAIWIAIYDKTDRQFEGGIELTLAEGADPATFLDVIPVVKRVLGGLLDLSGCTAVAGQAMVAKDGYGAMKYSWKTIHHIAKGVSAPEFESWWSKHYSARNLGKMGDIVMGYGVTPRIDPLTRDLNAALGFHDEGDFTGTMYMDDVAAWKSMVTIDAAKAAAEFESTHIARGFSRLNVHRIVASVVAG
jgi:hypothetical protein